MAARATVIHVGRNNVVINPAAIAAAAAIASTAPGAASAASAATATDIPSTTTRAGCLTISRKIEVDVFVDSHVTAGHQRYPIPCVRDHEWSHRSEDLNGAVGRDIKIALETKLEYGTVLDKRRLYPYIVNITAMAHTFYGLGGGFDGDCIRQVCGTER